MDEYKTSKDNHRYYSFNIQCILSGDIIDRLRPLFDSITNKDSTVKCVMDFPIFNQSWNQQGRYTNNDISLFYIIKSTSLYASFLDVIRSITQSQPRPVHFVQFTTPQPSVI